MATLPEVAPNLSTILNESAARDMAETDMPAPAEPTYVEDLRLLSPEHKAKLVAWLKWRLIQFVPAPFDAFARQSPGEIAAEMNLRPSLVLELCRKEAPGIVAEAKKKEKGFKPEAPPEEPGSLGNRPG